MLLRLLSPSVLLAAALPAQTFLHLPASQNPSSTELPGFQARPFMQQHGRVQMFFTAAEVGAASFTADELALRYDGPIPQVGAPGPFTIQRLRIRIGATAVPLPGARFAGNLTAPLATVHDGPWTYFPDPGSQFPHPWGAPNGSLSFPFTAPVTVNIPAGGWLLVELWVENNGLASQAHAILDGITTTGGPVEGSAFSSGQGCSTAPGQPPATITTSGRHAPGAAHFLAGQNLGSNALVFAMVGFSDQISPFGALPLVLPGTTCTLYQDAFGYLLLFADAAGAIPPGSEAAALVAPPDPGLVGLPLFEQFLSLVSGANPPWGFVLSDLRTVTMGTLSPPGIGVYTVSHGSRADAAIADLVEPFGYAVRLHTR